MASPDCDQEHINNLPNDIHQEIFSYLPLEDRKTAALVCRLWEQEAFSVRLLTNVQLCVTCHLMKSWATSISVLRNSTRKYRNVVVRLCTGDICSHVEYALIVDVLEKFGSMIEGFVMKHGCSAMQLKQFVDRMPNLKSMTAYVTELEKLPVEPMKFPALKSLHELAMKIRKDDILRSDQFDVLAMAPNVQRLKILLSGCDEYVRTFKVLKTYANQLRSMDLSIQFNRFPIDELRFEKLEVLKLRGLTDEPNSDRLCHLFKGLRKLKAAHLDFLIADSTLTAVCKNCPKLETLGIRADHLEASPLKDLNELSHLKIFKVNKLPIESLQQSQPISSITQLHLSVGNADMDNEAYVDTLFRVFPNVINMKICYQGFRIRIVDKKMTRHICKKFIHLTKLTICGEFCPAATINGFNHPGDLGSVDYLYYVKAEINVDPTSNNHVKRMMLDTGNPREINVHRIQRSFPELQYLEIRSSSQLSPGKMAEIRRKTRKFLINFVHTES